ncbi:MAG: phosphatidate cytidylyltransferase [Gammaproteobacteria bacterium]|nr:phosphatidate cytidylyltransferase [Gammaproteobacteria bacterium]
MLKQRVITALILVAFVLAALLNDNPLYWQMLINLVVVVAFWEWLRFCDLNTWSAMLPGFALFIAVLWLTQQGYIASPVIIIGACLLWVVLLTFTLTARMQVLHHPLVKATAGILTLSAAGWLVISLHALPNGVGWILCYLVAVFGADIGAYFVGRRFGKTKLAPQISPGKTVEGMLGGLALVLLIFIPLFFSEFEPQAAGLLLLTIVVTAVVSVGGDLFESTLKRHAGMKDSSQILPGHGGVLDRIDSLIAAIPFFALGLYVLGYLK